jgi:hypothetical protein
MTLSPPSFISTWTAWKPEDNYRSMRFENGQSCWNGPQRSLTLTLQCGGGETQVLSVDEPGKCVYHAVVRYDFLAVCLSLSPFLSGTR